MDRSSEAFASTAIKIDFTISFIIINVDPDNSSSATIDYSH